MLFRIDGSLLSQNFSPNLFRCRITSVEFFSPPPPQPPKPPNLHNADMFADRTLASHSSIFWIMGALSKCIRSTANGVSSTTYIFIPVVRITDGLREQATIRRRRFVRKKQNIWMFLAFLFSQSLKRFRRRKISARCEYGLDWLECRSRKPAA